MSLETDRATAAGPVANSAGAEEPVVNALPDPDANVDLLATSVTCAEPEMLLSIHCD